ncbi:hypothetical protein [Alishewanella phage vB_AspM_Slickus01]|nr:hypothetical protein [Alishewanella phage vB_AspM_Slickus01]
MTKMSLVQAHEVYRLALSDVAKHKIRLGQALMNNLPTTMYRDFAGTELDMFYFEDDECAKEFFFNNYISNF